MRTHALMPKNFARVFGTAQVTDFAVSARRCAGSCRKGFWQRPTGAPFGSKGPINLQPGIFGTSIRGTSSH